MCSVCHLLNFGAFATPERRHENLHDRLHFPYLCTAANAKVEGAEHINIVTGDRIVLTVLNSDAELEGISRKIMTEVARGKIAEAMIAYRRDRSLRVLLNQHRVRTRRHACPRSAPAGHPSPLPLAGYRCRAAL